MHRTRLAVAALLCLIGGALSLLLLSTHYGVPLFGEAALSACGASGGCDIVSQSRYASLFGLPLAAWGVFFYGSLLALLAPCLIGRPEEGSDTGPSLGFFLVALALILDGVLLGVQAFLIDAFCKFCIATYAVNGLLVLALWPHRQASLAMNFVFMPETRRSLGSWIVASLAVAAAALSANAALSDRKALAGSSILGFPMMPPASETVVAGSVEEQLAEARAEAKRWKDTLDDDNRLQQYRLGKAREDFNESPVLSVDLAHSPAKGPTNAPIEIVSYSDFMCPFCRDLAGALDRYLPTSGDRVRVVHKNFPLDMSCNPGVGRTVHPGACDLARGAICAAESGRFWEYHDKVFSRTWDRATREDVLQIGESVGLARPALGACIVSATTRGRLTEDIEEGNRIGVGSTPTVLINGRKLPSVNMFTLALEEERKRLNLSPLAGAPTP